MLAVIAMLFLLGPGSAGSETIRLDIAAAPEALSVLPALPGLHKGLQRLFDSRYGIFASLADAADPGSAETAAGASADASASAAAARVVLGFDRGVVTISTDLTRARFTRSLVSTVPPACPASLVATMAGDIAFLYFSSRGFAAMPLAGPPDLAASLPIDSLQPLTGWNPEDLEPVGLAASGDEVTLCFPHRYLTLGPLFRISSSTIRDIVGQSVGREPLQLSGIVAGRGGRLFLLSEREGRFAVVDPRLGTRQVADAPGLSGLTARLVDRNTVAALTGSSRGPGIKLYSAVDGAPRELRVGASYVSAFDIDSEGNLWTWDAGERRVRILTRGGREIYSIKPLFSAATMQLPQQLAVEDDGSFLLGGSAEVWKFRGSGIPEWRLTRIPGRPAQSLPASFGMAVDRSSGALTILDSQSRRLLAFSSAGGEAAPNSRPVAVLSEKAALSAAFAEGLARDLLFERADTAWLRAAETLRELTAESPDDESAAALLQTVLARRREARAALSGSREIWIVSARLLVEPAAGCGLGLTLEVRLRGARAEALTGVRVAVNVPSLDSAPSLAELQPLSDSQERTMQVPLGRVEPGLLSSAASVQVVALVTGNRGKEGISAALSFSAEVVAAGGTVDAADSPACRAVSADALASSLPSTLLAGAGPDPPQPLADLAGILGALGAARRDAGLAARSDSALAARPESALAARSDTAPAARSDSALAARRDAADQASGAGMRASLRSLSSDEADWSAVTASIASSLGLPAAILVIADRPLALVNTGIPFSSAMSRVPELKPYEEKLSSISPGGTFWMPLSGRITPAGSEAVAWSFADAMEVLAAHDIADAKRSDLVPATGENRPIPFPLVLPAIAPRPSVESLLGSIGRAAAGLAEHDRP